jgi:hypothetical protein
VLGFEFLFVVSLLLAKFKRVKGFGFEAEMWEEKQEEAAALVASLKQVQFAYAKAVFGILADVDVSENPNKYARRDAIKKLVVEEAERAGLNQKEMREILDTDRNSVIAVYAEAVWHYAHKYLNGADPNELQAALGEILRSHPPPDQLERVLNACKVNYP